MEMLEEQLIKSLLVAAAAKWDRAYKDMEAAQESCQRTEDEYFALKTKLENLEQVSIEEAAIYAFVGSSE